MQDKIQAAMQEGYSPAEVLDFIASQQGFNEKVAEARSAGYGDEEILSFLNGAPAAPQERTWAEAATDKAALFGTGTGKALTGASEAVRASDDGPAFAGPIGVMAAPLVRKARGLLGLDGVEEPVADALEKVGKTTTDYWESQKSEARKAETQQAQARIQQAEQESGQGGAAWQAIKESVTDPEMLVEQIPNLGVMALLSRIGGAPIGVAGGAALQGGDVASGTREALDKLPIEDFRQNSAEFQRLVQSGMSESEARARVTDGKVQESFTAAAAISGVANTVIPGGMAIEKALAGNALAGATLKDVGLAVLKGSFGEAASEATEEGFGQIASNERVSQINPDQGLLQGSGAAAGQGAVMGFAMGGGTAAAAGVSGLREANRIDATTGLEFNQDSLGAAARAQLDPAMARMELRQQADAAQSAISSAASIEDAVAAFDAATSATSADINLGTLETEQLAAQRQAQDVLAVDPLDAELLALEQEAAALDLPEIAAGVEVQQRPTGTLEVRGERVKELLKAVVPDAPVSMRADGSALVSARFAGPVLEVMAAARSSPSYDQVRRMSGLTETTQNVPTAESLATQAEETRGQEGAAQSRDDLIARYSSAEPFSDEESVLSDRLKDVTRNEVGAKISVGETPVFETGRDTFATITPSAQQPGMFQVTRYNRSGVMGDSQYKSVDDALAGEFFHQKRMIPQAEAEQRFAEALQAESQYQARAQQPTQTPTAPEQSRPAPIAAPTQTPADAGVSVSAPAQPTLSASGNPFKTERAAAASAKQRKLDMVPVAVDGGWGLAPRQPDIPADTITPNPAPAQAKGADKPKPKNLLQLVRQAGGVSTSRIADVTGDRKRPGAVGVFTKSGMDLDSLAELLQQNGFMTEADVSDTTSGAERATELLRQALAGERPVALDDIDAEIALREEKKYRDRIRQRASELGIRTTARRFDAIEADVLAQEEQAALAPEDRSAYALDLGGYNEQTPAVQSFLDDAFDPFSEATESQSAEDAMRALGFTEEEINGELQAGASPQEAGEADARGTEGRVAGADARQEGEGQGQQEGLTLDTYTNADIAQREAEQPADDTRAQADRERDAVPFTLDMQSQAKPQGVQGGMFTFDGRASEEAGQGGLKFSRGPRMLAIHNLSADNLVFADRVGGLAVPSVGVITSESGGVDGFGEITLIGTRNLVDPKRERVFSSDAYTARFPKPEWPKAKSKDALALIETIRPVAKEFGEKSLVDEVYDNMVNSPDANKVIELWIDSPATIAIFLREKGIKAEPVMRSVSSLTPVPVARLAELKPLYDALDMNLGGDVMDSPQWAALAKAYGDIVRESYLEKGRPDALIEKLARFDYRALQNLERDFKDAGKPEVDTWKTRDKMRQMADEYALEFKQWVESKVLPSFGEPFIKVRGKKAAYTLDNIVEAMTDTKVKGKETTMVYGAGQVRAAASVEFSDLEQMREHAAQQIKNPDEYEAARAETEKQLEAFRGALVEYTTLTNWRGEPDTWEALDASMRAIAKWATGKKRDAASMRAALKKENFDTAKIPDGVIRQAMDAANALMDAPVPYFEAKPQRAVNLSEFAGAVIPKSAPQAVRDILDKHGIDVREYDGDERAIVARQFAAELNQQGRETQFSFAGQNARTADTMALATAQQRLEAGEDAETVRQETGWFRGVDGKWRFEINDADASLKRPYPSQGQRWGDVWKLMVGRGQYSTVGAMIDHPALFAAYPQLANIPVSAKSAGGASYSPQSRQIDLGEDVQMYEALSVLLHEIQHGIQNIEGFASGGSERGMTDAYLKDKARLEDLKQKLQREKNRASDEARYASDELKAAAIAWADTQGEWYQSAPIEEKVSDYILSQDRLYAEWYKEHAQLAYGKGKLDPHQRYRHLAGEVEARNTQARQRMTDAERRATSPSATADVADADVIVVFNGDEMQSAPAPANAPVRFTRESLVQSISTRFPSLTRAVQSALRRGDEGKAGGVVVVERAEDLAGTLASKTGRTMDDAVQLLGSDENGQPQGFYDPKSQMVFMVAPSLTAETAPAVLLHEATHAKQRADIDARALALIDSRDKAVKPVRDFLNTVAARLEAAGETGNASEASAYIVEEAVLAGRKAGFSAVDGKLMSWIDRKLGKRIGDIVRDFVAMVRAWGLRAGVTLNPSIDDLVALAKLNLRDMGRGDVAGQAGQSRSAMKDIDANISRGLDALAKAVIERTSVHRAMFRNGLGWVDFVWGSEGKVKPSGKTKGAMGLSHIYEARQRKDGMSAEEADRLMRDIVVAIAKGEEFSRNDIGNVTRVGVQDAGTIVWMTKRAGNNAWVVTGYEKNPDGQAAGRAANLPTQSAASLTRDGLGAGFDSNVASNDRQLNFSRSGQSRPQPAAVFSSPALPDSLSKKALDEVVYQFQDRFTDLKKIQASIEASGRTIRDEFNPYMAETLMHGKAAYRVQTFLEREIEPALALMRRAQISVEDLDKYLHARHAKERNDAMAKRNPNQAELDLLIQDAADAVMDAELAVQADPMDGKAQARLIRAQDKLDALRNAKPWSGTEEERQKLSGMSNDEAKQILDRAHAGMKATAYRKLGEAIDKITAQTRAEMAGDGLESGETVAAMDTAYAHYVPLKRDMEESELLDSMGGTGRGFSIRGSQVKRATGSLREVENIFANIVAAREATIVRGEKNRVAKALYGMVMEHPNPDLFTVIRPGMSEKQLRAELQAMGLDPDTVESMVRAPTQATIDEKTGLAVRRVNANYARLENAVVLRVNGEDRVILFNKGSDTAVRLVRALRNDDTDFAGLTKGLMTYVGPITRYLSAINTQYNPIFGLTNFSRDVQGAMLNLQTTELADQKMAVVRNIPAAIKGIWNWERGDRQNSWAKIYEEFLTDGGATGYRDQYANLEDRAKAIRRELGQTGLRNAKGIKQTLDLLSDYNTAIENATRLAAYKAARDAGMSRARAADLAKDVTVNFNRKGARSGAMASLYAFFNSAVQGTERTLRVLNSPAGRKIIAGGVALGAMQAVMGMLALGDDWDEIPEFERAKHLIIPLLGTDGKYVKIPMPLGFHAITNVGRSLVEMAFYRDRLGERGLNLLVTTLDAFNPLGSNSLYEAVLPSVLDPFAQMAANENSFGRKIEREDFSSLSPTPGWTRAKEETSSVFKAMSYGLNWITSGGKEYETGLVSPTPEMLSFMTGVVTGGLGREAEKIASFAEGSVRGDSTPAHKIPVVSRFYGEAGGESVLRSKYYDAVKEINAAEFAKKRITKDGGDADEYDDVARLGSTSRKLQSQISDLNKHRQAETDKVLRKELEAEILSLQQQLVEAYDEVLDAR